MIKESIDKSRKEALEAICQAINILEAEKRRFNDELKDCEGRSVEKEYNSIYNALVSLKQAKKELIAAE